MSTMGFLSMKNNYNSIDYTIDNQEDINNRLSGINDNQENPDIDIHNIKTTFDKNFQINLIKRIIPSALISIGTGLAMMPVFNHLVKNSEDFGIDIRSNEGLFVASTTNTFIVASFSSFSTMYHFFKKYQEQIIANPKYIGINITKIGASFSIILPLGLLWGVELQNQKVAGSNGFDEFMAWATFTTAPLIIDRVIESVYTVDRIRDNSNSNDYKFIDLNSMGSKLVVYGLAGLSVTGRVIAYTEAAKTLASAVGLDSTASLSVGIIMGLLSSGGVTIFEYNAVKSLFAEQKEPMTIKKAICGAVSAIEGSWFTLPLVSLGLNFADGWNPLLKGVLFTPLFVSHTILEATKIYDNVMMSYDTISEGISSLGCCDSYTDLDIS